jgi:hypothetical protein
VGDEKYSVLVRKPEGKRLLGRPTSRWKDNIGMDVRETGTAASGGLL